MIEPPYLIMDGRARTDVDAALILSTADTLVEARTLVRQYGDAVIVEGATMCVVWEEEPA